VTYVLFFIAAIGVIAGAVGVIALRDPFFSVLALVVHLLFLALLFLLLEAQFVAAVQVVLYAGAVMVLYVFVVAYVGDQDLSLGSALSGSGAAAARLRLGAVIVGVALVAELFIALLGTGLKAVDTVGATVRLSGHASYGTPGYIGELLLNRFLLVFEIASFLLLIAAVGAVMLAGRSTGRPSPGEEISPLDLPRPLGTGTTAEGVGTRATLERIAAATTLEKREAAEEAEEHNRPNAGGEVAAVANAEGEQP
jgi:NADH-quinone oxidoreductase subunit J